MVRSDPRDRHRRLAPAPAIDLAALGQVDAATLLTRLLVARYHATPDGATRCSSTPPPPRNHTIAERMYRHDPAVMLHAPFRTVVCDGPDSQTRFIVDQPSTVFSSFGVPEISEVGLELDRKLAGLLDALEVQVPSVLRTS